MLKSKREHMLIFFVLMAVVSFIGIYLYQRVGDTLFGTDTLIQQKQVDIRNVLDIQEQAVEINSRYDEMKGELTLAGSNPEQDATIRKIMTDILTEVGLANQYGTISLKEQRQEADFKVAFVSITQIVCTPQQLGQLLFRIEKQSEVMDVIQCDIANQINEVGKVMAVRSRDAEINVSPSGLLQVDLQISRLIDYREGEKPKKRSRS